MIRALAWIWNALKRVWQWLLDNPVALAAFAGSLVGAYFMWKSRQNKIASLEDAVQVQAAKRQIAKSEAKAEVLEAQAGAAEPAVIDLKKQIADSKRRVVEISEGKAATKEMTDEEVARLFSSSGL